MILVERTPESTPTSALHKAITRRGPFPKLKWGLTLRIVPYCTLGDAVVTADAWYDVVWSVECVYDPDDPACTRQAGWEPPFYGEEEGDEETPSLGWLDIAKVGTLPAPPRIPAEQRIGEGIPEPVQKNVDRMSDEMLAVYGGREAVTQMRLTQYQAMIRTDRSADAYDWDTLADRVVALYSTLTPPKLTPEQRLRTGGARLVRARMEQENALASQKALVRNAHKALVESGESTYGSATRWTRWSSVSRTAINNWLGQEDS